MKFFVENFNGVLDVVVSRLKESGQVTDNYHDADAFVLWQDVRGHCRDLAAIIKDSTSKPVYVVQHGRGATRDYGPPNNFKLVADKILVWGEAERFRLLKYGVPDYGISVVGCPLLSRLSPRDKQRTGKNILFTPVIAEREQPENILVYAELKKWESHQLQTMVLANYEKLKKGWGHQDNVIKRVTLPDGTTEDRIWSQTIRPFLPRNVTYQNGLVNVKLTGVHDERQYMAPLIRTDQNAQDHVQALADVLKNIDVMVCLEEGTMQLLACALDIPVVFVDIFKYGTYGGAADYDSVEKICTKAVYRIVDLDKLGPTLDRIFDNPSELRKHRISVCEQEGGAHLGDANDNILKEISCNQKILA